jgi:hypothetical protein
MAAKTFEEKAEDAEKAYDEAHAKHVKDYKASVEKLGKLREERDYFIIRRNLAAKHNYSVESLTDERVAFLQELDAEAKAARRAKLERGENPNEEGVAVARPVTQDNDSEEVK